MKPPSSLDGRFTQIRSVRIGVWLLDDSLLQRPQHPIILLSTVCLSHEGLFMKGVFCLKIYALLEEVLVGHLKLMLPFLPVLTMTYCDPFCKSLMQPKRVRDPQSHILTGFKCQGFINTKNWTHSRGNGNMHLLERSFGCGRKDTRYKFA